MLLLIVDSAEKLTWKLIFATAQGITQHDFRWLCIWFMEKKELVTEGRFSKLGQYFRLPSQQGGTVLHWGVSPSWSIVFMWMRSLGNVKGAF